MENFDLEYLLSHHIVKPNFPVPTTNTVEEDPLKNYRAMAKDFLSDLDKGMSLEEKRLRFVALLLERERVLKQEIKENEERVKFLRVLIKNITTFIPDKYNRD